MTWPTVTRLRKQRPGWVAVELDGAAWRTLPAEAVVVAGLARGRPLDRQTAAVLARERRRLAALGVATAALAARDLTRAELASRLERRHVAPREAGAALEAVARAGVQDDGRAARGRAGLLAARGYGDEAIRADLHGRGVETEVVEAVLARLAPEQERAEEVVARLGPGPRTARALARRGFGADAIDAAVASATEWE